MINQEIDPQVLTISRSVPMTLSANLHTHTSPARSGIFP